MKRLIALIPCSCYNLHMKKETKLNNKIDLFYKRNKNTPRVAFCLNFSLNSVEKSPGLYSAMTRLLMQGTKNYTAEQLAEEFDKYAIEFTCELKQDYLRFRFMCLNEDFQKALELTTEVIKNTTFEDFDREIIKMQGEITAELDSPRLQVVENYYKNMFEGHSYGHTYTKILDNIQNLKQEDVITAYQNILNNSKKVIAFVGDLEFDMVNADIIQYLGDLPHSNDEKANLEQAELTTNKNVEIIKQDLNQAHIVKGWLVPSYESDEYPAFVLLNTILGASGLSSRLFLELRDKKGLAYVVRSSYEPFARGASFSIYIATEPKNIKISLDGFNEEIEKIRTVLVDDEELNNAKNNILGKWAFTQETNKQQACLYAHHAILGLGFDFIEKVKQEIKNVTAEQLLSCAHRYFNNISVISVIKP